MQQKNKKIRIDSYNYLSIEETITFHNVIILIKLFVNMNKNNYYYNIFLEKGSQEVNPIYVYVLQSRISIELTFLKELMLKKQLHQKTLIFATIGIS